MFTKINERYELSKDGLLRDTHSGRIQRGSDDGNGYLKFTMRVNGIKKIKKVHRALAEAFILNPDNLPVVNHKDSNKKNNSLTNLEWTTHLGNLLHAIENKRLVHKTGEDIYCSKLKEEDVLFLRKAFKETPFRGFPTYYGDIYGVHKKTIQKVISRLTWKHI